MKIRLSITTAVLFLGIAISAQVGVNTVIPKSTMDVSAKRDTSGAITDNAQLIGLQAPRLTRAELTVNTATYGADQKGALIYITDVSGGNTSGQRVNITAIGYYYFDGTEWQKFVDTDTSNQPTGFERLPNMSSSDFYWRLIGADVTKYGTEGKYGLDATWNPTDFSEILVLGVPYSTVLTLSGLTTSDLGARGKNAFTAGTLNSASGIGSTVLGIASQASNVGAFASGVMTKSTAEYATSMGRSTLASGSGAFAAGLFSEATNQAAVAMGNTSKASGDNSVAIGQANTASAQGTLALGNTNTASNISAVGIGQQNTASGQGSLAIGNTNTTSNVSSIGIGQLNNIAGAAAVGIGNNNILGTAAANSGALGFTNNVQGANSFAIGGTNTINGNTSYALGIGNQSTTTTGGFLLGNSNTASGMYAKAIGHGLISSSAYATSMGLYNTDEASPEATAYTNMTKRLFVIGNGTGASLKSDALTILRNGKTGLSASIPTETLDVGVGNVRVRNINTNTGSLATDKYVVADTDGVLKTVSAPSPVNIYNSDGSLTSTRTLTLDNHQLTFNGLEQQTFWSADGSMNQSGSNGRASLSMYGGNNSNLFIQQFQNAEAQISTGGNSTSLYLGTSNTNVSAPITFSTSAGSNANGTMKMIITGEGNVGINTPYPSPVARIHVVKEASDLTPAVIEGCNEYADNAAAIAAGLPIGALYRKADGTLMIRY